MDYSDRNQPLPFLVLKQERDDGDGPFVLLRSVPGGVVASGPTESVARERLIMKIEGDCFGGARAWYGRQLGLLDADRGLSAEAKHTFRQFVGDPWSYVLRDDLIMGVPVRFAVVEVADEVMFPAGLDLPVDPS